MGELREVWRDRHLVVVDKPSGLPTQPDRHGGPNVFDLVRARDPGAALHHRLDQPASGLVLLTLDPGVNAAIAEGFRTHAIRRTYLAVLADTPRASTWDAAIDGRRARTDVEVLGGVGLCAVRLALHTGRTHQIRRHAAMHGTPILGDRRYGGEAGRGWPRLALHAAALSLAHPVTGAPLAFASPLPADLADLWDLTGAPRP